VNINIKVCFCKINKKIKIKNLPINPNKGGIPAIDKITNITEVVINPSLEKKF